MTKILILLIACAFTGCMTPAERAEDNRERKAISDARDAIQQAKVTIAKMNQGQR